MKGSGVAMVANEPVRLGWGALSAVLVAMFAIAVGYGATLPILPFLITQISGQVTPAALSWHTGLLTGAYVLAIFIAAPVWGTLSDLFGRKPIILLGLGGFAATNGFLMAAESLSALYTGRSLAGFFAAAITPVAYALISDHAPSKEWRAHRFALVNIAGTAGFLVGPLLGGIAARFNDDLWGVLPERPLAMPLFPATGLAALAAGLSFLFLPPEAKRAVPAMPAETVQVERAARARLMTIAFLTALAIGVFEVGLALRGAALGLGAAHIGAMFAECSLVMAIVQALVFSPLIRPELTRWLFAPGLAILSVGLVAVSFVSGSFLMSAAIAAVAASAGVLSPVATYWASMGIVTRNGANLGRMTAAASLGQALGSAAGGLLFDLPNFSGASFVIAAALVLGTLLISIRLPRLLMPEHAADP